MLSPIKQIPAPSANEEDLTASRFPDGHPHVATGRVGVLIVNLGTPDGTSYWPMRRYLSEFLSDRRVIEMRPLFWQPILQGLVLSIRPRKSGKLYAAIWNTEADESPLRTFTRRQGEKLGRALSTWNAISVDWAMRYGNPSIPDRLRAMQAAGCDRILVFPLYPQYSATTTATVNDAAFDALKTMRRQPALRTVPAFHDDRVYIEAIAEAVEAHLASLAFEPEVIVASYHGLPSTYFRKGDPYHCHCQKTSRLISERLGIERERFLTTFQSRFGPEEWLQPYTDKTIEELARKGVKRIAVVNPGFISDCLETLEEIAVQNREVFLRHGGEDFSHIPCLNDSPPGIRLLEAIVLRELQGWV